MSSWCCLTLAYCLCCCCREFPGRNPRFDSMFVLCIMTHRPRRPQSCPWGEGGYSNWTLCGCVSASHLYQVQAAPVLLGEPSRLHKALCGPQWLFLIFLCSPVPFLSTAGLFPHGPGLCSRCPGLGTCSTCPWRAQVSLLGGPGHCGSCLLCPLPQPSVFPPGLALAFALGSWYVWCLYSVPSWASVCLPICSFS